MDKSKKLKRYQRKDYSLLVSFPVEIIGRDGVVRRYSFEASVRLYQRRIASAPLRYHDPDVAGAEQLHCRSRISQLRRSYCEHYGWPGIADDGQVGEFAGEVVAFIGRFVGEDNTGIRLGRVQSEANHFAWFVEQPDLNKRFLLYLYRFESNGPCPGREAFFELLRHVQGTVGCNVERMVAFHHTADCGLVLTATGEQVGVEPAQLLSIRDESTGHRPLSSDALDSFQRGIVALSVGDPEAGLTHLEHALAENPYRYQVHICVMAVTDYLQRDVETEIAARVALHYFPEHPDIYYMQALAHYKAEQYTESIVCLEQAARFGHELGRVRALRARIEFRRGRRLAAVQALRRGDALSWRPVRGGDPRNAEFYRLLTMSGWADWAQLASFAFGVTAVLTQGLYAGIPGFAGVLCLRAWRKRMGARTAALLAETRRTLGLGLPENLFLESRPEDS